MTAKKRLNARDSKSRSFGSACSIQAWGTIIYFDIKGVPLRIIFGSFGSLTFSSSSDLFVKDSGNLNFLSRTFIPSDELLILANDNLPFVLEIARSSIDSPEILESETVI